MCEKKIVNQKNHLQCRGVLQQQKKEIVPRNDLHQPLQEAKIEGVQKVFALAFLSLEAIS